MTLVTVLDAVVESALAMDLIKEATEPTVVDKACLTSGQSNEAVSVAVVLRMMGLVTVLVAVPVAEVVFVTNAESTLLTTFDAVVDRVRVIVGQSKDLVLEEVAVRIICADFISDAVKLLEEELIWAAIFNSVATELEVTTENRWPISFSREAVEVAVVVIALVSALASESAEELEEVTA